MTNTYEQNAARLEWLDNEIWTLECTAVSPEWKATLKSYRKEREELIVTMSQSN